ncbi:MAG: sterol desaturase family protein [Sandaracinus sp.]|nr:sterol desaturase family protein [Myxococcales bacterium]MCB9635036.1 sterol desaturase family protein [Sandaracinus sp.]
MPLLAFLVALAVGALVFGTLERCHGAPRGRPERGVDVTYAFLGPLVVRPLTRGITIVVAVLAFAIAHGTLDRETLRAAFEAPTWLDAFPRWARVLGILVVADGLGYFTHRLFHRGGMLWRAHAVHHSSEHLDWLASFRVHPLNELLGGLARVVPLLLLGARPGELAFLLPFLAVHALLLHAHVPWRFGPLRYLVASPAFHRWHHSVERDCNYAGLFPMWDLLFGTFHLPEELPERTGTRDRVPRALLAQLAHPFRRR